MKKLLLFCVVLIALSGCDFLTDSFSRGESSIPVSSATPPPTPTPEPTATYPTELTLNHSGGSTVLTPGDNSELYIESTGSLSELFGGEIQPSNMTSELTKNGEIVTTDIAESGDYLYTISVTWADDVEPVEYRVPIKAQLPISVLLASSEVILGESMTITVKNAIETPICSSNLPLQPQFFSLSEGGTTYVAILPISYDATPGEYTLTIASGEASVDTVLQLVDREFTIQNLTIDQSIADDTVNSDAANYEYNVAMEPVKAAADPEQYWEGDFIFPLPELPDGQEYRITTEFGLIRYVNGSTVGTRHGAIDIAAGTGTPTLASGAGRVLYADFLQLTGNTVVIEHGYGLKSLYYHMHTLDVEAGDMVEQGEVIGTVGSTGFSTGAHMHFAMAVNSQYINPWEAFEEGYTFPE